MEINVTSLLKVDQFNLSHSQAEGGPNAGRNSWQSSIVQAEKTPLLDTEEKLQAMRNFARESGGWDADEISDWTPQEVNALFLQWIAGDCRELGADTLEDVDWIGAEKMQQEGQVSSNLFRGDNGQIYFYLGY